MASQRRGADEPVPEPEYYEITHEMMAKGAENQRGRKKIRQFAVLVRGSVRVITSGDTVDRETYRALVLAEAIKPEYIRMPPEPPEEEGISLEDGGQGHFEL